MITKTDLFIVATGGIGCFAVWRLGIVRIVTCTVGISMVTGTVSHSDLIGARHFGIRVFDTSQVKDARRDIEIFKHLIAARALTHF